MVKSFMAVAAAGAGLYICFVSCNSGDPLGPVEAKDYVVYLRDNVTHGTIFGYHTVTEEVDSFQVPYAASRGPTVSADGRWMYFGSTTTAVIELNSFTLVEELPYNGTEGVAVSPDNRLVAVLGDGLHILNTSDFSEVFHDTDKVSGGIFSADSKSFYCQSRVQEGFYVYKVDVRDDSAVTRKFFSNCYPIRVLPSPDQSKWFLYVQFPVELPVVPVFEIYDVGTDSIIFVDTLHAGYGDMELTPDGKYAFCTEPGDPRFTGDPPFTITVFDVERNELHKIIDTRVTEVPGDPDFYGFNVGKISITPDGRWLIGGMARHGDYLVALDVHLMELVKYVQVENSSSLLYTTCQLIP